MECSNFTEIVAILLMFISNTVFVHYCFDNFCSILMFIGHFLIIFENGEELIAFLIILLHYSSFSFTYQVFLTISK